MLPITHKYTQLLVQIYPDYQQKSVQAYLMMVTYPVKGFLPLPGSSM